jgi:hypothetical protein
VSEATLSSLIPATSDTLSSRASPGYTP